MGRDKTLNTRPSGSAPWLRGAVRSCSLAFFLSACFLPQVRADAQLRETRRVLILNDLGIISSPGFAEIDQAIFSELQKSPYQIELYHESLELTLFPDDASQRRFREEVVRKYSDRKLDVIIAAGSASLQFVTESPEKFLKETPIIFCTVLGEIPDQAKSNRPITGVLGRLHPEESLDSALRLLPDTKHVVVVGGMGKFDNDWEGIARQGFRKYESKLEFTYLTDLTMPALLERLKHLPSNTIVYHTAITEDAAGKRFIDSAQSVPLVASAANAPVFVMDDVDLRGGTVGGDLVNWADDARVAAQMAVRVLNGEKPEDIPIVTSNNAYIFDWPALQRWGLKVRDLPPGSIVLHRPPSFWQQYWQYVVAGILVFLAQTLAILALLWQRVRRRKTEEALASLSGRLIDAQEEEHKRIAREIHDDYNQRLAVLANDLDELAEHVGESPRATSERLHQLWNGVSEIAADLHTLSHSLHPSTLENLGLVAGMKAFCNEFSGQQQILVHLAHENVPRAIPADVALCLFRVTQEGLRNIKRHSGTDTAEVRLERIDEKLHLSICDRGRGFDVNQRSPRSGIGIRSMEERLRSLGGYLEVRSRPMEGTRIDAWLPFEAARRRAS
jgi:signal transduction histidine kinase